MAYVTETPVASSYFSVRIFVEGIPAAMNTFRAHIEAARPNVMRFFDRGLPFKIETHCTWRLRDPDEGYTGTMHLTSVAKDVLADRRNSINSWDELVAWLEYEEDRKRKIAENSGKEFESVSQPIILVHPGQQMGAAAEAIDLDNLEPPEPEPEDEPGRSEVVRSDFVKLPEPLVNKMACISF